MSVDLGGEQIVLERVMIREALSEPFEITVDILSEHGDLDLRPHLGNEIKIKVEQGEEVRRLVHGHVVEGMFVEEAKSGWRYRLTVRPWTHFMDANIEYRIHQEKTATEILRTTFQSAGISDVEYKLEGKQTKRTYCVQYGESDFDFICRLMEEEGIYYFFRHEADRHVMVLCDNPNSHSLGKPDKLEYNFDTRSLAGNLYGEEETPFVTNLMERVRTSGRSKVAVRDWDFRVPQQPLAHSVNTRVQHARDEAEVYLGAGKFVLDDVAHPATAGATLADATLLASRADRAVYTGLTQSLELSTGSKVKVTGHDAERFNIEYLVTGTQHLIVAERYRSSDELDDGHDLDVAFEAIPASTPYKSPLRTPKPVVRGLESAIVTGPPGEVIHTDEFGRVKVQFHWDRLGKKDAKTSCWIRVSQTGGLGNVILPRIGHEVLVDFLGGDPDRPVVVGRVFNAEHMPIYPLPYNRTISSWRSKTVGAVADIAKALPIHGPVPAEGGPKDWENPEANELRFEDKSGQEEVYFHANRLLNTRVRMDETHKVGQDQTIYIGQNRTEKVEKDEKVEILGKRDYTLTGNETEIILEGNRTTTLKKGNRDTTLDMGNETLNVKMGNISVKAAMGKIEMEAMQSIELKVGSSTIKIDQTGVTIKGMMIKSEAQVTNMVKGTLTTTEASAMMTVKGAITMIN
jgi:type VI secretion system secreted protein VgrG